MPHRRSWGRRTLSRRNFLKTGGAAATGLTALSAIGMSDRVTASADDGSIWVPAGGGPGGIGLSPGGQVVTLATTTGMVGVGPGWGGLSLRDPRSGQRYPVTGSVERNGAGARQRATVAALEAEVDVTYAPSGHGTVEVSGVVIDQRGADRVLDTLFSVPLAVSAGIFETGLVGAQLFDARTPPASQISMPLAVASDSSHTFAIAYAIDPAHPCQFEMGIEPAAASQGFYIRQMWGLSPAAAGALQSRAPFTFEIDLGLDPAWTYRSGLQRYYDRSPEFFTNPAGLSHCAGSTVQQISPAHNGYGGWQYNPRSRYPQPAYLAFHAAGAGVGGATTLEQYAANDEWPADQENCVATLPYTIAGQREITNLAALPATYSEAMADFASWTHAPHPFGANVSPGPGSYDSSDQVKEIIENSALYDGTGRFVINIRHTVWGGNSVTFPLDANPRLYANEGRLTIAKYLLERYIPWMLSNDDVDGIYADSLFNWGLWFDYRRDHFPAATIPLTYTTTTSQYGTAYAPGLSNDFSTLEYLWALRGLLHANGKILMANGVRARGATTRVFDGFACDVFGNELNFPTELANPGDLAWYRMVAYQKPALGMLYQGWDTENDVVALWKLSLLYGFAPESSGNPAGAPIEEKYENLYMPVLKQLLGAGWVPMTGITADHPSVQVERYGSQSTFYLVIYNGESEQTVSFGVDERLLPRIAAERVDDVLTGGPAATDLAQAVAGNGQVTLPAGALAVLHVGSAS